MRESIEQRIIDIVATQAGIDPAKIRPGSTLDDLRVPSIQQIEVFFAIEEAFDVDLPKEPEDRTLTGLADLVAGLVAQRNGAPATGA
jgi:acyl carrier protein